MARGDRVRPSDMRDHLESLFADAHVTDGLFGPTSMVWRVGREASILLGGGRAALLQLAHPYIAHAIDDHSAVLADIQGRFQRTMSSMFALTFGDRAEAMRLARHIYEIHQRIGGEIPVESGAHRAGARYSALDRSAMYWVAATIWDTSILLYEQLFGPLSLPEKEQYYAETKTFCRLFGLSDDMMPKDWSGFRRYFDDMVRSSTLHVGETARRLGHQVLAPTRRAAMPMYSVINALTAGLMPEGLRDAYDIPYSRRHRLLFDASMVVARRGVPALPDGVRYCPPYLTARRRISGQAGDNLVATSWKRLVLELLRQRP